DDRRNYGRVCLSEGRGAPASVRRNPSDSSRETSFMLSKELQDLAGEVSNWGRWGPDDQRGTLNFLTPESTRRGAACVRRGVAFSLAIPFDEDGPQTGSIPGRTNPKRDMLMINTSFTGDPTDFTTSDDAFSMGTQAATHWDALSHAGYDGM